MPLAEVPAAWLDKVLLISDFAYEHLQRRPFDWPGSDVPLLLAEDRVEEWPARLRIFRQRGSLRLIVEDAGGAPVDRILASASQLAERCIATALAAAQGQIAQRHGWVRDKRGQAQSLVVFALGKLGGGELNFSSDVDLIFAWPGGGDSDGARALDAERWMLRSGQRLIQLLDEVDANGFCYRVDMRLRPFGASGRLALPFAAMEQYYQQEGRDWERYAWIKARPVAGDVAAGERLLEHLRPFVYRRYLDYGALDGLREMKALIAAEVERRDLAEHIKLGPGGIRELEFLVQALQLVRAGREPALRQRNLLTALAALAAAGHFSEQIAARLADAYRFLRRLENRLQMLADLQTHQLPESERERTRLALGLGFADWDALYAELQMHRGLVSDEFTRLLAPRRKPQPDALAAYWRALPQAGDPRVLGESGFVAIDEADAALRKFAGLPALRALSPAARGRLDRLLPALLKAAGSSDAPALTLQRLLELLNAILRRSSYFALLEEKPQALQRLVDVVGRSNLLADRLIQHPLLLDELLDSRLIELPESVAALSAELERLLAPLPVDEIEERLRVLNEFRHATSFRIALATLARRQPASTSARQLAWLAESIVRAVLPMAAADLVRAHGQIAGGAFLVLGYGSIGGCELGFASDLDLVFVFDAPVERMSDGARPLEAARWYAKLAQKLVTLLGLPTPSGRLYTVDVRLRPDGAGGLLVSSIASFAQYQQTRAWAWEHQALVRARPIAGDAALARAFAQVRARTLGMPRARDQVLRDVGQMRQRMRAELDRSRPGQFDLKHGVGGLIDLEFALQAVLLAQAAHHPALLADTASDRLLREVARVEAWTPDRLADLLAAHETLLRYALDCTLDRRPRLVGEDAAIVQARTAVRSLTSALGLKQPGAPAEL